MPSPIAHSLLAIAAARLLVPDAVPNPARWYALAVVAANAADLDVVAGALTGSINALHGGASHSVMAAILCAAVCAVPASRSLGGRARVASLVLAAYGTHIVLDLLTGPVKRRGLPLLWPFTDAEWMFPWLPFDGIRHGGPSAGMNGFVEELISVENLRAVTFEAAVLIPVLGLAWFATRRTAVAR